MGAAPWHLGQLASSLLIFDIFRGAYAGTPELADRMLKVTDEHVSRAANLLKVVLLIKETVTAGCKADPDIGEVAGRDLREAQQRDVDFAQLFAEAAAASLAWSQGVFADFPATQLPAAEALPADAADTDDGRVLAPAAAAAAAAAAASAAEPDDGGSDDCGAPPVIAGSGGVGTPVDDSSTRTVGAAGAAADLEPLLAISDARSMLRP